jgi:hypothetical protein
MKPQIAHRLPPSLEAAMLRLRQAVRDAAERTIESLGLAALACGKAYERDGLLAAQFELNRKSAVFTLHFEEAFDERVLRELGAPPAAGTADPAPTSWDRFRLVEDREVEAQISADRFGMEISHACEWELRELDGYVASLLPSPDDRQTTGRPRSANPLRPEVLGQAIVRALEGVSDRADTRRLLALELQRSLISLLPATYGEIVGELRRAGVQPMALALRVSRDPGPETRGGTGGFGGTAAQTTISPGRPAPRARSAPAAMPAPGPAGSLGAVDPALMNLMRQLTRPGTGFDATAAGPAAGPGSAPEDLPTVMQAHREALRRVTANKLDHLVIDVVGTLFDQILSDPKVPPQIARQIARLQVPMLRAALGDPSFFSSRRHPVRRFVNRIASVGAAMEDMSPEGAQRLLDKVGALVQEVVEGDFEQVGLYEAKLSALEDLVAELSQGEMHARGDAHELLAVKEDQLRLRQVYAQRLEGELDAVPAPAFLRQFLARVWSQVLVRAAELEGGEGPRLQRWRQAGRDLFVSVQPKSTPAQRKAFLAELPHLMQELVEGLDLIGWPQEQRNAFFGQLMPAHAEALKAASIQPLEVNLMTRQVEGALQRPLPSAEDVRRLGMIDLPVLTDEIVPGPATVFSPEEARRVGLVDEATVDWHGQVAVDPAEADAPVDQAAADTPDTVPALVPGLPSGTAPAAPEPPAPTEGAGLLDALQLGSAYRMHLQGQWQRVRLSHMSEGRSFFAFTHGRGHLQTVSMTRRMLARMCESGRLKAYESAHLLERATARARQQLAALNARAS